MPSVLRALGAAPVRLLSAVTRVELFCVIEGRKGETGRADVELLLRDGDFEVGASRRSRPRSPSTRFAALAEAAIARG